MFFNMLSGIAQKLWSLDSCIQYALDNNLEILNSKVNNGIKTIELKVARNERLPDVNASSNVYSKFGQAQDVFGTTRRNDNLNADVNISSSVNLYNYGKLKNEVLRADKLLLVSEKELAVLKRNITIKVIEHYLAIQLNKEIARAVDSAVFYTEEQYNKAVKTTQAGTTALTVQYEAKANFAKEKQKLKKAQQEVDRAKINMAQLLQLDEYKQFEVESILIDPELAMSLSYTVGEAIDMSQANHPELKKLQLLKEVTEVENRIIKADLYPLIKGGVSVGSFYFNSLTSSGDRRFFPQIQENFAQQVAVSVSIPIFNKGRVKNSIKKNNLFIKQNEIHVKQELTNIRQEVEKLYFDYYAYLDQLEASVEMYNSAKMALAFTSKSYDAGKSSIYDLNTSRGNSLNAESEMLQAKYNCLFVSKMIKYYVEETL